MSVSWDVYGSLCTPNAESTAAQHDTYRLEEAEPVVTAADVPPHRPVHHVASSAVTHRFHFRFTAPWGTDGREVDADGEGVLTIPVKVSLVSFTVGDLVMEFVRRLKRRYGEIGVFPSRVLLKRAKEEEPLIDLPGRAEAETLYQQMGFELGGGRRVTTRPYPARSTPQAAATVVAAAAPRSSSMATATAAAVAPRADTDALSLVLDCVMNAEDTLDGFIPEPLATGKGRSQGGGSFDVVVEGWQEGEYAAYDGASRPSSSPSLRPACNTFQRGQQQQRTLSQSGRLDRDERRCQGDLALVAASSGGSKRAAALPMTQRSTYVDLLLHRRRQQERCGGANEDTFSIVDVIAGDGDDDDDDDISARGGGVVSSPPRGKMAQLAYEARVAFEGDEQTARDLVAALEESDRRLVTGLHDDSMRHLLTLEALQGNYMENGRLAALLRKHCVYPYDTLPLARTATADEKQRLATNADNTALLSFQFLEAKQRPKTKQVPFVEQGPQTALLPASEDPLGVLVDANGNKRSFRELMQVAVEHEKRAQERELREEMRREYYLERGEPLPPREPTPPPSPPPPRTPTMDEIPTDTLASFTDDYTDGRHEIIRVERKVFRAMTTSMKNILAKQLEADALMVQRAYEEELQVAESLFRFNFNVFNDFDSMSAAREALPPPSNPTAVVEPYNSGGEDGANGEQRRPPTEDGDWASTEIIYKYPTPRTQEPNQSEVH